MAKLTIMYNPCPHATLHMDEIAAKEKRHSISWAVLHPQHAGFPILFKTKREAEKYRKEHASAYIVCRVAVVPLYGKIKQASTRDRDNG